MPALSPVWLRSPSVSVSSSTVRPRLVGDSLQRRNQPPLLPDLDIVEATDIGVEENAGL